jgi:hypothetical protein
MAEGQCYEEDADGSREGFEALPELLSKKEEN